MISLFISGRDKATLPREMFNSFRQKDDPTVSAAASFLFLWSSLGSWPRASMPGRSGVTPPLRLVGSKLGTPTMRASAVGLSSGRAKRAFSIFDLLFAVHGRRIDPGEQTLRPVHCESASGEYLSYNSSSIKGEDCATDIRD